MVAKEGVHADRLGRGQIQILQDPAVFKFTVDPILVADFLRANPRDTVLDLGTGGGVIPLWLAGYRGFQRVTGLELQPEAARLARESVALNRLSAVVKIIEGDLRCPPPEVRAEKYAWVVANPPYLPPSSLLSGNILLDRAKFELTCTLADVVKAARDLSTGNGRLVMVHLAERLVDVLTTFRSFGFEPKLLRMVHPGPGKAPHRVLVEGHKAGRPHLRILPPLYIHDEQGRFSEEMTAIYHARQAVAPD
ncbi:MAG TPA: tRNA1(Val) (adenine(37)-N6)-methyltransferase [Firmicutes bacterium]|jgi:tRNA1Val (adenine37-N6)-methyltransferase|nr:tRNA1(Val) (adenine(37)-N6)-methyltransferase [Bacillota bacterium]HOQ24302.1 tRNA1(Val) (adenine(37)-N6)-methyltransferase [Bacillota bacterium]HPT67463.1 tRNA1(Val) (adenine(37)-N6)-methyltransferase [Bacillota bacterium]